MALTSPTSDFIQSDEDWWQSAWSHGISVGEIEFDESAGVWSVDISIRIDTLHSREPVGVMKTILAIEPIQRIADWTTQVVPGAQVQIATVDGALIAETSSGHDRARIMSPDVNVIEEGDEPLRAAFTAENPGFEIGQEWLTAFARVGGQDAQASAAAPLAGFAWVVILQRPAAQVHQVYEPIDALPSIEDALHDWRATLALALVAMAVLSGAFAVILAVGAARRYATSLHAVSGMAERAARGEMVSPAAIEHPVENVRLNDAVSRLSQAFRSVLERDRPRQ